MKKLCSHFGGCLLFVCAASILSAWMPNPEGPATPTDAPLLFVGDTTRISCVSADSVFGLWYNNTATELSFSIGGVQSVTPEVPDPYAFPGICSDTLSFRFVLSQGEGNPDTTVTRVLLVQDLEAPVIQSTIADSLALTCMDQIPDSTVVTVTDNCALDTVIYQQVILGGDCPFSYKIVRTWDAWDGCGNRSTYRQVITVSDLTPPAFNPSFPLSVTIDCAVSTHPDSLGRPVVTDNCDTDPQVYYQDSPPVSQSGCQRDYSFERRWFAVDTCGNANILTQSIRVRDQQAPTFTAPRDTMLDCSRGDSPAITGVPTAIRDNCAVLGPEHVTYKDLIVSSTCLNTYTVRRTWYVSDGCNNIDSAQQTIQVRDLMAPVFTRSAQPLQVQCGEGSNIDSLFHDWANRHGDALATDNCNGQVQWIARNAGTSDTLRFPDAVCNRGDQVIFERRVDFIAMDACGLSDTTTALFQVLDVVPPELIQCPSDTIIGNSSGACSAAFTLPRPLASDECSVQMLTLHYRVNTGPRIEVASMSDEVVTLPLGENRIQYFIADCSGQMDSCTFKVTVEDREAPRIMCPGDTTVVLASGACVADIAIPLPVSILDNCSVLGGYQRILPADPAQALLTFNFNPNLNSYVANGKQFIFGNLSANATDSATLIIRYKGDFSSPNALLQVRGEGSVLLASTLVGSADCSREGQLTIRLAPAQFNAWAADGQVAIAVNPLSISSPSGQAGEGVNPCDPIRVTANGQTDGTSAIFAELRYPTISPSYYTTGATVLPLTTTPLPQANPVIHTFNQGVTEVFYIIADASGNTDTCNFEIRVVDQEAPKARCQPTTLFINPAGLENPQVDAQEIDAGSTDNCMVQRVELTPNTFNCAQAGTVQDVVLTVFDASGNSARCSTIVRIENLEPEPTASSDLCGADTLFLRANPPQAVGGVLYTYRWSGPNGFLSNKENPVLPNVTSRNAGSYMVEVTGLTGCKASGVVEVSIEDLPLTPELMTQGDYCEEEAIVLHSSIAPSGSSVLYRWYQGTPPNGVLVGTSIVPSFTINGPHSESVQSYYLAIESSGCISQPSAPKVVRVNKRPLAIPNIEELTVCAGQAVMLGTEASGPGITYSWAGPNGYSSTSQYPAAITTTLADAGDYQLVVSRYGCASAPAFVAINVLPKPSRPEISNTGAVCAGGDITLRTGSPATKYTWISPNLLEFPTSSNSFQLSNVSKAVAGAWRVYITVQGCQSDVSLPTMIVVNELPKPSVATSPAVICDGGPLSLSASPTIVNATYRWVGPNNFSAVGITASIAAARTQNAGRYALTIVTPEGCAGTTFADVEIKAAARIVAVTNDGSDCLSGPTDIRLTSSVFPDDDGTYSFRWTGPNGYVSTSKVAIIPKATQLNNGNYQLIVTTAQGCISAPVSTLVAVKDPPKAPVAPRINESAPGPVCQGGQATLCIDGYQGDQVVYSWVTPNKGIVVTTVPCLQLTNASANDAGAYAVFVTVDGCRSRQSANTILVVNSKPVIAAFSNSPVCAGRPLELRATVIAGATYEWVGPNFSSSLSIPIIPQADSALHAGIYAVSAVLNGCRSDVSKTLVSVLPTPVQPVLEPKDAICISTPGTTLGLTLKEESVTPGATYAWFGPLGPLGSSQSPAFTMASFSGYRNGVGVFTVQAQLGSCSSLLSAPLEVTLNTIPEDLAFAGSDFDACDAEAIYLAGLEPALGTGRWTVTSGPNISEVVIASPNKGGTAVQKLRGPNAYTFRWTLSNGACTDYSFDEVRVQVSRQDTAFAGVDQLVCLTPKISLAAKPSVNGMGSWSQSSVQAQLGVRILESTNPITAVSGMQPGNLYAFTWTVRGGCGNLSDEVLVLISDPSPYAGKDQHICTLDAVAVLQADQPTEGSKGKWLVRTPGVQISDSTKLQPTVSKLQPGANQFIWEIDQGICGADSRDTVVIQYTRSPEAFADEQNVPFGAPIELPVLRNDVYTGKVRLRIVESPTKGTLQLRNDSILTYTPGINYVGQDRFRYEVCADGCTCSTTDVVLEVGQEASCDVPSIITPNNDGVNDLFIIPCLLDESQYPNNEVLIFNRSGNEVYRSRRPYQNNWRGTFNGEDLPVGTYFYIIDLGDGSTPLRGFFVIQR